MKRRRRPFQKFNPLCAPLGLPLPQVVKNNWNIFDLGYNNTSCFSTLVSILSPNCYTLPHVARICHCSFLSLVSELLDKDWEFNLAASFLAPPRFPPTTFFFFKIPFPFIPRSRYIFPENTAWVRTGTVNGPLVSLHRLNSGHFGDRKAKGEGERGRTGGTSGAKPGERVLACRWTRCWEILHTGLLASPQLARSPWDPALPAWGPPLIEALSRLAWSRSGVRGGWPPSVQTDSWVAKLGQSACQPRPSPSPFQARRRRGRWGWVELLIRRPPAERARPSLSSTSLSVWRRISRVIWVIAFQGTSSGQRLSYILNSGLQLAACLLGRSGSGGSLTQA